MTVIDKRCPICNDCDNIEKSSKIYPEIDQVECKCKCLHCGFEWTTVYGLICENSGK